MCPRRRSQRSGSGQSVRASSPRLALPPLACPASWRASPSFRSHRLASPALLRPASRRASFSSCPRRARLPRFVEVGAGYRWGLSGAGLVHVDVHGIAREQAFERDIAHHRRARTIALLVCVDWREWVLYFLCSTVLVV